MHIKEFILSFEFLRNKKRRRKKRIENEREKREREREKKKNGRREGEKASRFLLVYAYLGILNIN